MLILRRQIAAEVLAELSDYSWQELRPPTDAEVTVAQAYLDQVNHREQVRLRKPKPKLE